MLSTFRIRHISELARLRLSAEEEDSLGRDLSDILEYIERLEQVEVSAELAPESSTSPHRADEVVGEGMSVEEFLDNAPRSLDRFLIVPSIK